jgi:aminodeoxyfutalosine deaminase
MNPAPVERALLRLPKVEIHVHLEGAMRPAVLLELARRHEVALPASDEAGLKRWFRFRDFGHFVEIYLTCSRTLRDPEDFQLLMSDFLAEQACQSVFYSEVHFTIGTHLSNGANGGEVLDALRETIAEGEKRLGVIARLIPDIVRNVGPDLADRTLEWALAGQKTGTVVALGLSGSEARFPNEPFVRHFEAAHQAGLHCVAHAGEHAGPESIRSVLDLCHAERIGHGIRAVDDPELVLELVRRRIPVEVSPSSNICLGAVASMEQHPFDRLYRAGVAVSVNSDDPSFFNTNLTREYLRLHQTFGYGPEDLRRLALAGLEHAFVTGEMREKLERRFRNALDGLGWSVGEEHSQSVTA